MLKYAAASVLACLTAIVPAWAQTNYDPFSTEIPSDISADWSLIAGTDFIDGVSGGFATTSMSPGDGLWQYDTAGLSNATGWTLDTRVRIGLANTLGQRAVGILMREPGGGQLELRVNRGEFALAGEGAGILGGAQPFDFADGLFHTIRVSRLGSNVQVFVDDIATPFVNATFTQNQDFGGNRVFFGKVGGDNAGLAVVDSINWDNTQATFSAPGNNPGNNQPRDLSGQPAFQLGWYVSAFFSDPTYTTDLLDEMQARGFNTVRHADMGDGILGRLTPLDPGSTPAAAMAFMDAAAARGIGVEVNLRKGLSADTPGEHANLRLITDTLRGHPALSMYQIGEEPSDPGGPSEMPIANFRAMSSTVAAMDPDTPISAVFIADNTAFYGDYITQVDVAPADYYPVRNSVGWDTPGKMRQAVGRAQDLVAALGPAGATPVWVGQAFGTGQFDLPTAAQQRYMTWAPITVGVKGAMYFAYQHMTPAERAALIYSVTDELVTLIPAITSDTPAPTVTSDADSSTPGDGINDVTYITRMLNDAVYIMAAGNQLVGQTVAFTVADTFAAGTLVEVVGESRTIVPSSIGAGSLVFSDSFDPLSIRIYKILQALAGDLNGDGFVGIADLNIVLGSWNQSVPPGNPLADPSGDGFVGIADLNVVLGNWNAGTPPTDGAAVPEPTSLVLIALGGVAVLRRRS
jgi:PEP-CTERM motif